jgi:hypothetical protein
MLLNAAVQELIAIDHDCFNLLEAYISSVEYPCTVDSTSSSFRLPPHRTTGCIHTPGCIPEWISHPLRLVPGSAKMSQQGEDERLKVRKKWVR